MNFENMKTEHYAIILVGIVAVILLFTQWNEQFNVVPIYPHLPPKHWSSRRRVHWSPHWQYENKYHPAVPKFVHYDSSNYVMPLDEVQDIAPDVE